MSSVTFRSRKAKDPFQLELDKEIARRRKSGLAAVFSEESVADDVQSDVDDDDLLQQYSSIAGTTTQKHSTGKKWKVPSYLEESDDDDDDDDDISIKGLFSKKSTESGYQQRVIPTKKHLNVEHKKGDIPAYSVTKDNFDPYSHSSFEEKHSVDVESDKTKHERKKSNSKSVSHPHAENASSYNVTKDHFDPYSHSSFEAKHSVDVESDKTKHERKKSNSKSVSHPYAENASSYNVTKDHFDPYPHSSFEEKHSVDVESDKTKHERKKSSSKSVSHPYAENASSYNVTKDHFDPYSHSSFEEKHSVDVESVKTKHERKKSNSKSVSHPYAENASSYNVTKDHFDPYSHSSFEAKHSVDVESDKTKHERKKSNSKSVSHPHAENASSYNVTKDHFDPYSHSSFEAKHSVDVESDKTKHERKKSNSKSVSHPYAENASLNKTQYALNEKANWDDDELLSQLFNKPHTSNKDKLPQSRKNEQTMKSRPHELKHQKETIFSEFKTDMNDDIDFLFKSNSKPKDIQPQILSESSADDSTKPTPVPRKRKVIAKQMESRSSGRSNKSFTEESSLRETIAQMEAEEISKYEITKVSKKNNKKQDISEKSEDVLELFDQVTISDNLDRERKIETIHVQEVSNNEKTKSAEESVVIANNEIVSHQRSSQQLMDSVIKNVSDYNEFHIENAENINVDNNPPCKASKSPRRPSDAKPRKKSSKTPPIGYQGLGTLTAFHQLQTSPASKEHKAFNSSADLRNSVYLNWLADREKKLKAKKLSTIEAENKMNEKKKKESEDKFMEGLSARKAWLEKKEEDMKIQQRLKRRKERKQREEEMRKEEEKWKSEKKADTARQQALKEARKNHREVQKKKREDELLLKSKEEQKKKENKKAVDEWMDKRSSQWEDNKKKEMKDERKKNKEKKKTQEEKREKGKDAYQKWQERTDEGSFHGKSTVHTLHEDRPPWSPANKVIPYHG